MGLIQGIQARLRRFGQRATACNASAAMTPARPALPKTPRADSPPSFWADTSHQATDSAPTPAAAARARAPILRVVHSVEAQGRHSGTVRLRISGRLADVCAELDRLASLEAQQEAMSG